MKKIHLIITISIILTSISGISQVLDLQNPTDLFNRYAGYYKTINSESTSKVKGTRFLFNDFNHSGILVIKNNKYKIQNNINIDLANKFFIYKISQDSIYVFNDLTFANIDDKDYKIFNNKILECKFKKNNFIIFQNISKYKTKPMRNPVSLVIEQGRWESIENEFHYSEGEDKQFKLKKFKLKKKNILSFFSENKQKEIIIFVKKNKLSYKKINDVIKIFKTFYK